MRSHTFSDTDKYDIDHQEPPANAQSTSKWMFRTSRVENTTSIGTERNLWSQYFEDNMKRQYGLKDSAAERAKLDDHAGRSGSA
jgi:hypothetical protein